MGSDWPRVPLKEVGAWISGGTPSKSNSAYWGGDIPWISAKTMRGPRIFDSDQRVTQEGVNNGTRIVKPGTILLLVRGSILHQRVPVGIAQRELTFNQDVKAIVPSANFLSEFLLYWFLANEQMLLSKVDNTGIGAGRLPTDVLNSLQVPCPPIEEQNAIVHILGSLDDKVELNHQMNQTLENIAQAIFKSWFIDFDPVVYNAVQAGNPVPDKFVENAARYQDNPKFQTLPKDVLNLFPDSFVNSEIGEIPTRWEVKSIGDCVRCLGGGTPSTKNPEFWDGGTNPFLTPKDMSKLDSPVITETERHLTESGVEQISSRRIPEGAVMLSSRAPIGYLGINEIPVSVNQGIIAMICDQEVPNYYILLWVRENMERIKGKAGGTTFAEISKKNFRTVRMYVPAQEVLKKFMEQVEPIYNQISINTQESKDLTLMREALLPKLLSGDLHPPDFEGIERKLNE